MFETALTILLEFWAVLCEMAPYLLFGFFAAGVLSVVVSPEWIERHLGGRGMWPTVKAALFGIPLPLCSCAVIPVSASLRKHGATRGATTAFLLSTPQTGVDSILVTFSLLGPVFAVFRPVAAFVTGLVGGAIASLAESDKEAESGVAAGCGDACCSMEGGGGKVSRAMSYGFVSLPRDIAKPLVVGLALAGLISAVVPDDFFAGALGTGIVPMLVMMVVGIPIYVCATASVPVAAALITKGVSAGAALVFLMTGPATNAAALTTVWNMMGKRIAAVYLGTVAVMALASGILLDYIFTVSGSTARPAMLWMIPGYVQTAGAVLLFVVLGAALFRRSPRPAPVSASNEGTRVATFLVSGMTCEHCVRSVRRSLRECNGVDSVEVDRESGKVTVGGREFDLRLLRRAVEELGYLTDLGRDRPNAS